LEDLRTQHTSQLERALEQQRQEMPSSNEGDDKKKEELLIERRQEITKLEEQIGKLNSTIEEKMLQIRIKEDRCIELENISNEDRKKSNEKYSILEEQNDKLQKKV